MSNTREAATQPESATPNQPQPALSLGEAETAFLRETPEFARTRHLDEMRASEYGRLDNAGHVYLDYTGGGLYAESQVRAHTDMLLGGVFGNPHSSNPTSLAMTQLV